MKRIWKTLCIALTVIIMVAQPAQAAEIESSRASSFFISSCVYLWKTSNNTFEAWFEVSATKTMDELGARSITIQKSYDGVTWTPMITYTRSTNPQMICANTGVHTACVNYIGSVGCYYRAKIVLYAKDGSDIGEMIEYTPTLKL